MLSVISQNSVHLYTVITIGVHCTFKLKTVLYCIFLSAFANFTGILVRLVLTLQLTCSKTIPKCQVCILNQSLG